MKRYRLCGIFLLFFVHHIQIISPTENVYSVLRSNGIRPRSISTEQHSHEKTTAEQKRNAALIDDNILSTLINALNVINTPECLKDFNATIIGIQQRKPWAIASEFFHICI